MLTTPLAVLTAAMAFSCGATAALAAPVDQETEIASAAPRDTRSTRSAYTPSLAPFAHVLFCKSNPDECRPQGPTNAVVTITPDTMALLRNVNAKVNASIRPARDESSPLGDVWTVSPARGDCDDYMVTKRHHLIEAGLPASALRLAVTRTSTGEGHAVLVVRTDRGDLILDNLSGQIRGWKEAQLQLVKIQSGENPKRWMAPAAGMLASLE